jgi:NitT/TauT family transport system permease protein
MALAIPLSALALWELASRLALLSPRYFPPPTLVAATLAGLLSEGDLWGETLVTLNRLAVAFVLAAAPGVTAGLLMGLFRPVRNALEPYVALLYPLPKIALLPLFLILLGVGEKAFILTGAITAFFQVVISTLGGVQSMDPRLLEVGRNYGARGVSLFRKIILPAVLPSIFTGLRLGVGLALIAVIAVEFVTAKSGLGHLVFRYWQMLLTAEMFAAFVLVGLIGLALTRGLRVIQQRALNWKEEIGWL